MHFSELFKVFSKRISVQQSKQSDSKPLTVTFRNRVFMRCRDLLGGEDFWIEIHTKLTFLHGRPQLSKVYYKTQTLDVLEFLQVCDDIHFLDFIEYIFSTKAYFHRTSICNLVGDINEFFRQDDLPYALNDFVWTKSRIDQYETTTLTAYPQVIRKDSEIVHKFTIEPTLHLLRELDFGEANKEFLKALEDYRKADYGDCITKCGSAFESVLKIICTRKRWQYNSTDTAAPLIKTVVNKAGLEQFFEQPFILVATIRNRLSNSHGAGLTARDATEAKAEYTINATAAAIIFLVKTTR